MDFTTVMIFLGFIGVGFIVGYPIGMLMERRSYQPAHFFDSYKMGDPVLEAEYLEEKV
jgi:hypothetical protein